MGSPARAHLVAAEMATFVAGQGVTSAMAPEATAAARCGASYDATFEIAVAKVEGVVKRDTNVLAVGPPLGTIIGLRASFALRAFLGVPPRRSTALAKGWDHGHDRRGVLLANPRLVEVQLGGLSKTIA